MKDISVPEEIKDKCRKFAEIRTNDSLKLYQFRGESRRQKIFSDIFFGALAEHAVNLSLISCSLPDLKLHENSQKSYSADLTLDSLKLHVKSQGESSAKNYGMSWIFQKNDPAIIKNSALDYIILCLILHNNDVRILGALPFSRAVFRDLKVSQYNNTKTAVYYEDVKSYTISMEELYELSKNNKKEA